MDVLLQMTEWARLSEDLPVAAELTEQALYSLENSFHPMFSLSSGKCRLDYRLHENRCLNLKIDFIPNNIIRFLHINCYIKKKKQKLIHFFF